MTDYKTVRVREADYQAAKESKHDDESWSDYIRRCTDEPPDIREFIAADEIRASSIGSVDTRDDLTAEMEKLREQIERLPDDTADELEGRFR